MVADLNAVLLLAEPFGDAYDCIQVGAQADGVRGRQLDKQVGTVMRKWAGMSFSFISETKLLNPISALAKCQSISNPCSEVSPFWIMSLLSRDILNLCCT